MSERIKSAESFDEFFGSAGTDNEQISKQSDITPTSAVAALIKTQPFIHHRQSPSKTKPTTNSKKMPLTTNITNPSAQSKHIESPPSKTYASDFDDNASTDEKKKHSSLPPPKERFSELARRGSDSKFKPYYKPPGKENLLPYIRPKNRTKRLQKETKNESKQRVLSAEHEHLNQLQSRLTELRRRLEEERLEKKTLLQIQKREEQTLKKYEDEEDDIHRIARDYIHEMEEVKDELSNERESKEKLEKEMEDRDELLRDQTKQVKFYQKLVEEPEPDDIDQLREKLKESDKKLKKYQDKFADKQKYIEDLEKNHRQEIYQELSKRRDLKHEIETHSKKYTDLLLRCEEKSRQVGTMHIYLQHGGRRPSISSLLQLSKTRSYQSLEDTSPRLREKILEYDKKRREEVKLKPKPKLKPLPNNPPVKQERKKYVPSVPLKPKPPKISSVPVHEEKPPEVSPPKSKPPVRRLSTPTSSDEDEIIIKPVHHKPLSPPPTITAQHLPPIPVLKPPSPSISSPLEFGTGGSTSTSSLFKHKEPLPTKSPLTREFGDTWPDILDVDKKEESAEDDFFSKLISDEQQERKFVPTTKSSPPSSQRPSMIMFEPSSSATNGYQNKPPTRITTTNVYEFDQTVVNLHAGKPVTTQPITKTSVDTFDSLFDNNTTKSTNHLNTRDDTFTTTQEKSDPFDSIFMEPSSAADTSTTIKVNLRQLPSQNDKLQRPKVVTNAPRPVPNRTVVEEIEEFLL